MVKLEWTQQSKNAKKPKKEKAYFIDRQSAENFMKDLSKYTDLIEDPVITDDVVWGE